MPIKFSISAAAFCAIALTALNVFAAEADELDSVRKTVADMFDLIEPEDVKPGPIDGWYTIQKGSIVAYISGDSRYLFQGDLIDLDSQVNMTEAARNDSRRVLMSSVSDEQTIMFSPADIKHSVTVFTDVDCTYCRRLHAQIDQYLAYGIEVRYLLYPRNGPTSRSWTTSEQVWCASDRASALTQAKLGEQFETAKCDASAVQDHFVIGRDVGLSGTPAIVLDDGTLIAGYMPPEQLKARLDQADARP